MTELLCDPVVVDANQIVRGSWDLTSPWWLGLLGLARAGLRKVIVPEIVIAETVRHHRVEVVDAHSKRASATRKLARLGVSNSDPQDLDLDTLSATYEAQLRARLAEHKVEIDPTPDDGLRALVDRLISRRQPFKDNGTGLADAVIWTRVLAHATWSEHGVALITSNAADFGDGVLATDLLADLETRALTGKVRLIGTVREFIERITFDDPALHARAVASAAALRDTEWPQIAINISEAVKARGVEIPDALADVSIDEVEVTGMDIQSVSAAEVEGLPAEWVVVTFRCAVDLTVSGGVMAPHVGTGDLYGVHSVNSIVLDVDAVLDLDREELDNFAVRHPIYLGVMDLGPFY